MRFRLEQRFCAPLTTVEAAFVDPELLAHLSGMADLGHPQLLEQVTDGNTILQRVRYRFTGVLSPTVATVLDPDRLTWVEISELDRQTHRQPFRIVPDHYGDRLRCAGVVVLGEAGGGTIRVAEADLDVRLRFWGQSIARTIVAAMFENAAAQERVVADWLARRYEQA